MIRTEPPRVSDLTDSRLAVSTKRDLLTGCCRCPLTPCASLAKLGVARRLPKGASAWGEARRHGEQAPQRDGSALGAQADRRGCRRRRGRPANSGTAAPSLEVPAPLDFVYSVLWPT